MRKFFLQVVFLFSFYSTFAQDVSIPEGPFKTWLISRYPSCFVNVDVNGFLMMNTACTAITSEDTLEFHLNTGDLDLTGLQYFISVVYLDCSNSRISQYEFPPNLKYLDCSNSMADAPSGSLTGFPASLEKLICAGNAAGNIALTNGLKYVDISLNYLTTFSVPSTVDTLICRNQWAASATPRMTSLPALPANLRYLDCSENQLSSLPPLPASLGTLICADQYGYLNPEDYFRTLSSLPNLPTSLQHLDCNGNLLTTLPVLPAGLRYLNCAGQRVFLGDLRVSPSQPDQLVNAGISVLPALPLTLEYLNCSNNNLTSLPSTLPAGLTNLDVRNNVYTFTGNTQLDGIRCLPHLPSTLASLNTANTLISCHPNSGSYTAVPARPLCTPINNSNQCVSMPVVSGDIFLDNNSNGTREGGENFRSSVQVNLSNGQSGFTDQNGYFELTGNIGSNTLTIVDPVYYSSVPASRNYNFSAFDEVARDSYALQPTTFVDSFKSVVAAVTTARPGFAMQYECRYENVGTTVLTPQVSFTFDNTRMVFSSASVPGSSVSGNIVTIPGELTSPGQVKQYSILFTILPTTNLGDTINVTQTVNANGDLASDSLFSIVSGSFDPNDKVATPNITLEQVDAGGYLNYQIRFQNTGTDTAFTVIVTDQLSNLLDASSFQLLATSHNCKATKSGSDLLFEFINILLPDSNINELASHGWIRFRVKPLASVAAGQIIPNAASIYFDFNIPIITNTANTLISVGTVVPVKLLSFTGQKVSKDQVIFTWKTENETNVSHYELERSRDGQDFSVIQQVPARTGLSNIYIHQAAMKDNVEFFRLKILEKDGIVAYSNILMLRLSKFGSPISILNNPARGQLKIYADGSVGPNQLVRAFNSNGQLLKTVIIRSGFQAVDINSFPPGIYHLDYAGKAETFVVQ